MARTVVEILDSSLNKIAEVKALVPLNKQGMVLRYSKELSDYGTATFRISILDPLFDTYGDIVEPHRYHVRIKRAQATVWQGAIVDNPKQNKSFIEVVAVEYEYYLDKILVRRSSTDPATNTANGLYRIFSSGTMAAAIGTLVTEVAADFGGEHVLSGLTAGDIENPDYPLGFNDANSVALTGAWNFSDFISLQFDLQSVLYVLKAFGMYTNCDFRVNNDLELDYQKFLGNRNNSLTFQYGTRGNIIDYNLPRLGRRMVNDMWGIAVDNSGNVLHVEQVDTVSLESFGKLESATGYADVKDQNFLKTRVNQDLQFVSTPDSAPINLILNEKGYPLGQYDIGDIVTVKINNSITNYFQSRRIVGITVNLHNTGREITTVQTNQPREEDLS